MYPVDRFLNGAWAPLPLALSVTLLIPLVLPLQATAFEWTAEVHLTEEYSDNSQQSSVDEIEEWVHLPGASITASHEVRAFVMDLDYSAEKVFHENDDVADETITTGSGNLAWHVIPERLSFSVGNTRSETSIDPRLSDNRNNRQVISRSYGDATLTLPVIGQSIFSLSYRFEDTKADETDTSAERTTVSAGYSVPLSNLTSVQLNASVSESEFDSGAPDTKFKTATLGITTGGRRLTINAAAGMTEAERDGFADVDGPTGNLDIRYQFNESTAISAGYSRSLQDQSSGQRFEEQLPGLGGLLPRPDDNQLFRERFTTLEFSSRLGRTDYSIQASETVNDVELEQTTDQTTRSLGVSIGRQLTRRISMDLSAQQSESTFGGTDDRDDDHLTVSTRLNWETSARLSFGFQASYTERESNVGAEYEEFSGSIQIGYQLK